MVVLRYSPSPGTIAFNRQKSKDFKYKLDFVCSFFCCRFLSRLYWYPLKVLYSSGVVGVFRTLNTDANLYGAFNMLLWILLALNIYWFFVSVFCSPGFTFPWSSDLVHSTSSLQCGNRLCIRAKRRSRRWWHRIVSLFLLRYFWKRQRSINNHIQEFMTVVHQLNAFPTLVPTAFSFLHILINASKNQNSIKKVLKLDIDVILV